MDDDDDGDNDDFDDCRMVWRRLVHFLSIIWTNGGGWSLA